MFCDFKKLEERCSQLKQLLSACRVCPRSCDVNRRENKKGICKTGRFALISSYGPHFGEEKPLVGKGGSGTIFFTYCNLKCIFCQNYDISQQGYGNEVEEMELAEIMLYLQKSGCENINLVSPSHVVPQIAEALLIARKKGLKIPVVYNSGGYDSVETLKLLEGFIDIYMPDFKYWKEETSLRYSIAPDYPEVARKAVREMHKQVGDLVINSRGVAIRGLIVRHLVMPGHLDETERILKFIAEEVSKNTYINIMDQYRPLYRAHNYREIARRITSEEYERAISLAHQFGLHRIDGIYLRKRGILF